jgi:hypothetical protein
MVSSSHLVMAGMPISCGAPARNELGLASGQELIKMVGFRVRVANDDAIDDVVRSWIPSLEGYVERFFLHRADTQDGKPEDVSLVVDFFHHLIICGFAEIAGFLFEDDFEVIAFGVVPDLHASLRFGHSRDPFLVRSVRYAVRSEPDFEALIIAEQLHSES